MKKMEDSFWLNNYNTPLNPEEKASYQIWLNQQAVSRNRDLTGDKFNYDLQGYWKNGGQQDPGYGHMPDTYKKPNHPTFNLSSIYNGLPDPWGGTFQGGEWQSPDVNQGWMFQPSQRMLNTTIDLEDLRRYFDTVEKNSVLQLPIPYNP